MRGDLTQRRLLVMMLCVLMAIGANSSFSFAEQDTTGSAVINVSGAGVQITMVGTVQPTILSVTMPSNILFDIGKSSEGENKVLSPEVRIRNHSDVPIAVYAEKTEVDLGNLPGAQYVPSISGGSIGVTVGGIYVPSMGGIVTMGALVIQDNEIAIGLSAERVATGGAVMPGLSQAKWLVEKNGGWPLTWMDQMAYVSPESEEVLHVVGMIGRDVPENRVFTVRPTLIATMW